MEVLIMANTVEYYLSKGFDLSSAEYYASGRKRIVSVIANDNFALLLTFDNGEKRILDMRPALKPGTVFEKFIDINHFKRVYLDENHCVSWDIDPSVDSMVVWNNKVDLCPDSCYIDSVPIGDATYA